MASQHDILDRKPQLIEHFISLEGEGITVGRAALFIRTNQCNLSCNFCDTAFSITGKHPTLVDDMTSVAYTNYLKGKYNLFDRDNVTNLSITGGEPLLNLNYFGAMIDATLKAFPNINKVVIETNGFLLREKENCFKLIEQVGKFYPKIHFILSLSPKLSGKVSFAGKVDDISILNSYKEILANYKQLLSAHFDIQLKTVYSATLIESNEPLITFCLVSKILTRDQILVMPFTPKDPMGKNVDEWTASKNAAARYALGNYFRYSPRIHIDRNLS